MTLLYFFRKIYCLLSFIKINLEKMDEMELDDSNSLVLYY